MILLLIGIGIVVFVVWCCCALAGNCDDAQQRQEAERGTTNQA